MIEIKHISSGDNVKFKNWNKLIQRKYRDRGDLFLIEGELLIRDALKSGGIIEDLIVSSYEEEPSVVIQGLLEDTNSNPKIFMLSGELFDRISQTEHGRLVIGVFQKPKAKIKKGNILILDGIQDPGNMGTLIRTADAAGFGGIISMKGSVDHFSPKVVRAAAGSIMRMPIICADNIEKLRSLLNDSSQEGSGQGYGVRLIATGLKTNKYLWDMDFGRDDRVAIVIGNEGSGVSQEIMDMADDIIKIPMSGEIESLNAGISGAIVMYEVMRQQRKHSKSI